MYTVSDRNEDKARHEWRAELREDRVLIFLSLLGPSLLYFFAVSFFSRFHHTVIPRKDRQRIFENRGDTIGGAHCIARHVAKILGA